MTARSFTLVSLAACSFAACSAMSPTLLAAEPAQQDMQMQVPQMQEPQRRDDSFKLPAGQAIQVDNPYGSVYLRFGGYEHQLDIRSTVQQPDGAAVITFKPAARDGRFNVVPQLPEGVMLAQGQRIDLVLYVPQAHPVTVRTVAGVIESRGLKSDIDLVTDSGEIAVRGTDGTVQARTGDGRIEITLEDGARPGSVQRIVSRTGGVTVNVSDKLDAEVRLSTSHQFSTDYSLTVEHRDGEEPNKVATAVVGAPKSAKDRAQVVLESLVSEVRLQRKGVFVDPE
jgi:hypothetical protein